MSRKLSRTAREMVEAANVDPENIFAFLQEEAEFVADLVKLKMQDFIDDDLVRDARSKSLEGYKAIIFETFGFTPIEIGGERFRLSNYQLKVVPRLEHAALSRPINVFEILDQGRKELPRRPKGKFYPLWDNTKGGGYNVPPTNQRVRDSRGRFTTQFRARPSLPAQTPTRREPRKGPGKEPALHPDDRYAMKLAGIRFFHPGPLPAVPPRNLYKRMLAAIKRDLKRRDLLPIEIEVELDGD